MDLLVEKKKAQPGRPGHVLPLAENISSRNFQTVSVLINRPTVLQRSTLLGSAVRENAFIRIFDVGR